MAASPLEPADVLGKLEDSSQAFQAAEAYAERCKRLSMPVDPSIAVWLRLGGSSLQVPFQSSLLPACEFLAQCQGLKKLSFRSAYAPSGTGNANARVLRHILAKNQSLETLDLAYSGIDSEGVADLCEGLRCNKTLKTLSLRGNYLGPKGGQLIANLLEQLISEAGAGGATSLRELDISMCSIGSGGVRNLAKVAGFKAIYTRLPAAAQEGAPLVNVAHNFETEELWNAITHGLMFFLSLFGTGFLMYKVSENPVHHIWGAAIFCFGLIFCFGSSTLYHSLFLYPMAGRVLQVLDHAAIYLLIAGTYTPFLLFYSDTPAHVELLKAEWILCWLGIVTHICSQYFEWGTSVPYLTGELLLYLMMGWAVVLAWDSFTSQMPALSVSWLVAGGLLYTGGVPFFMLADYRPIHHVIWHLFVAAAAICHWIAVKEAAQDALLHHSHGSAPVEWWVERFHEVREEIGRLHNETQDHGVYRTLMDHLSPLLNGTSTPMAPGLASAFCTHDKC